MHVDKEEKGLTVSVLRNVDLTQDCTLGGLSSKYNRMLLLGVDGPTSVRDVLECHEYGILRIARGSGGYVSAKPLNATEFGGDTSYAFGGNFVHASDSRFSAVNKYPIPIHDRDLSRER